MGIFGDLWKSKEEVGHKAVVSDVCGRLKSRLASENPSVRMLLEKCFDVAENSLRGVLFLTPENFKLKKILSKEEVETWFGKVCLALVCYSYGFFSITDRSEAVQAQFRSFWQGMIDAYNRVFGANATFDIVYYYVPGISEEVRNKYASLSPEEQGTKMMMELYIALAGALLGSIWHINIEQASIYELRNYKTGDNMGALSMNAQRIVLLGEGIWQTHLELVQPILPKLAQQQ
ncbi:MAG: hypothetical protein Q7S09_02610 [bacterium]|nr:hypothetical protein [bacterium]